jgi:hypothetical protein
MVCFTGCHHPLDHQKTEHRSVDLLARDYDTNDVIAVFTLSQTTEGELDCSRISLRVKNLSAQTVSFSFILNVDSIGYSPANSFVYNNSVVELAPGEVHNYGVISKTRVNIYDANIYFVTPIYAVFEPTSNG